MSRRDRRDYHRAYMQRQYTERRRLGLCVDCAKPVGTSFVRCPECLTRQRLRTLASARKSAQKRREVGACLKCEAPAVPGRAHCETCLGKARDRQRLARQRQRETPS